MPFEIGKAINSMADTLISAPMVETIAKNPIYTAFVITFIIVLIVLFIFRDVESDESLLSLCLRSGFYIFILLTGALLVHNKALMMETSGTIKGSEVAGVFDRQGGYSGVVIGGNDHGERGERNNSGTMEDAIIPVQVNYDI